MLYINVNSYDWFKSFGLGNRSRSSRSQDLLISVEIELNWSFTRKAKEIYSFYINLAVRSPAGTVNL